tara:strand:- start:3243 stop:4151 length:909 start_codon:yes stop_codon:yes gene_type:complete
LLPGDGGYLVARATGSGAWLIGFTTEPVVPLSNVTAVQSQTFGQFIVQGSDNIMRTLTGPAIADLYPRTNAAGQITFETLPTATVPDPLVVNDLTVVTNAAISDLQITGTATATGLATGTLTNVLGLNAANEIIKGTIAVTGSQCAMFFESPTSPAASSPNANPSTADGNNLIIGNLLFDSAWPNGVPGAGVLLTATNTQTITVLTAGVYVIDFGALIVRGTVTDADPTPSRGRATVQLTINGAIVNNGNGSDIEGSANAHNVWGQEMRRLAANDVVRLTLAANYAASRVFNVRVNFTRLGA